MLLLLIFLNVFAIDVGHAQKGEKCLKQAASATYFMKLKSYLRQAASDHLEKNLKTEEERSGAPKKMLDLISSGEACQYVKEDDRNSLMSQHKDKMKLVKHASHELSTKKKIPSHFFVAFNTDDSTQKDSLTEDEICSQIQKNGSHDKCSFENIIRSKMLNFSVNENSFEENCKKAAPIIASGLKAEEECLDDLAEEKKPGEEISPDVPSKGMVKYKLDPIHTTKKAVPPKADISVDIMPSQNTPPTSGRPRGASGQ
jgi:hypothetical protein